MTRWLSRRVTAFLSTNQALALSLSRMLCPQMHYAPRQLWLQLPGASDIQDALAVATGHQAKRHVQVSASLSLL
jgi:hypothetical protein